MEFWTKLIVVAKEQAVTAAKSLKDNCTYVANWCWIFEGDEDALEDDGVKFNIVEEGAVSFLGDLSKSELVDLCENVYGVDVYKQSYDKNKQQPGTGYGHCNCGTEGCCQCNPW